MQICFFSDDTAANFNPLTLTRPLDDLRLGIFTIRQKWEFALSADNTSRIVPDYLSGVFPSGTVSEDEDCFWINPRFLPSSKLIQQIKKLPEHNFITYKGNVVAARINGKLSQNFLEKKHLNVENLEEQISKEAISIQYLWDLLSLNQSQIIYDIRQSNLIPLTEFKDESHFVSNRPDNIYLSKDVIIEPGCIIDAEEGPVVIQSGARIEAGSILRGPVAICEGATVKMASRIYGGTTVGPVCKIGGEVSGTIFHSYTNKAHDGFVGSSLFGQWINLGANTVTSNLKNDYSFIKVVDWDTNIPVDTGLQFFGTVMGDHSKTAINTTLNTGTVCGVSSNIFTHELTPNFISSFCWLSAKSSDTYRFDKALEVMQAMMKRRNIKLTKEYQQMMQHLFNIR